MMLSKQNKKWLFILLILACFSSAAFILGKYSSKNKLQKIPTAPMGRTLNDEFQNIKTKFYILTFHQGKLTQFPNAPYLVALCQGEGCGKARDLTLARSAQLLSDAEPTSSVLEELPQGELLKRAKIFTKVIQTQTLPSNRGIVLYYGSEGEFAVMHSDLSVTSTQLDDDQLSLVTENWIYAETSTGKTGWIPSGNEPLFEE